MFCEKKLRWSKSSVGLLHRTAPQFCVVSVHSILSMDFVHSYYKLKCFALLLSDCEAVKFIIATYEIRGKKKEEETTAEQLNLNVVFECISSLRH